MENSLILSDVSHTGQGPYEARSASDRDPNWHSWFVADRTGFNGIKVKGQMWKLFDRESALMIADHLNGVANG